MDGKPCATQYQPNINPLCNPLPTLCEVGDNITTNIRPIEACDGALESSRRDRKHATLLVGLIGVWFRGGWTFCKLSFQSFVQPIANPLSNPLCRFCGQIDAKIAGRVPDDFILPHADFIRLVIRLVSGFWLAEAVSHCRTGCDDAS